MKESSLGLQTLWSVPFTSATHIAKSLHTKFRTFAKNEQRKNEYVHVYTYVYIFAAKRTSEFNISLLPEKELRLGSIIQRVLQ